MPRLLAFNNAVLFLCCSIYLGTGISMVFFHMPVEPLLTPQNYEVIFVGPVARATDFFTPLTMVMLVTGVVMLVTEWFSGLRWVPVVVLAALIASTLLTIYGLFPHNDALSAGITDPQKLADTFAAWASLNRIRVSLWCVEWVAMMIYFYKLAIQARADR